MRIAFVTGSLEPGRDGVGDYTRTLAAECVCRGHAVRVLSVADRESGEETFLGQPALRRMTREQALTDGRDAYRWLEAFAPDWTSLQFVPFSFDPRGLFARSIPALVRIMRAAPRRHVIFHEIWIGAQQRAPWKARFLGAIQRRAVIRLLQAVDPRRIHTSTEFYRAALGDLGVRVERLPMFGSVPWCGPTPPAIFPGIEANALVCGMFGTVHPDWQPAGFMADLAALAAKLGRPVALVSAGGLGPGTALFAELALRYRGSVNCVALGRLPEPQLAEVFARFDFAVTSVPWNILGKSSSAAALREHGLRVVATMGGAPLRGRPDLAGDLDDGFVPYFRDPTLLRDAPTRTKPRLGVSAVTGQLLDLLEETKP